MTFREQMETQRRIRSKPGPVQECIKIMATKLSIDEPLSSMNGERIAMFARQALENWNRWLPSLMEDTGMSETLIAEDIIQRLRANPEHGWSRVLRHGTH